MNLNPVNYEKKLSDLILTLIIFNRVEIITSTVDIQNTDSVNNYVSLQHLIERI